MKHQRFFSPGGFLQEPFLNPVVLLLSSASEVEEKLSFSEVLIREATEDPRSDNKRSFCPVAPGASGLPDLSERSEEPPWSNKVMTDTSGIITY